MNRHEAREYAFQTLFQLDINKDEISFEDNETVQSNYYLNTVIEGVITNKTELDERISKHLENWTINRIALAEKTILRIALFEVSYMDDIPTSVSINEAVELGHKFGDEKSGKFINGVLSKIINQKE